METQQTSQTEAFPYIDCAIGGPNQRNNIRRVEEFNPNGYTDCYRTYLQFPETLVKWHKENDDSVSGYRGTAKATFFPVDFDCKEDAEKALEDLRKTTRRWEAVYGLPLGALRVYYSGYKGFSVEIPEELFGGFAPGQDIYDRFKAMANELLADSPTADFRIYGVLWLWRTPNTKNSKSGLYKIPLETNEWLHLSLEELKNLAREKRPERFIDASEFEPVSGLVDLWVASKKRAKERTHDDPVDCEYVLSGLPEGERDWKIFRFMCSLRRANVPRDAAEDLALKSARNCTPPFPDTEALRKVASAYKYPPGAPELSLSRPHYKEMGQGQSQGQGRITSMTFAEIEDPGPQEYVWGTIIPKNKPAIIYGAPGTIKSIKAQSFGQAVADPSCYTWLGHAIPTCNVMYADWELGPADQYRRAVQIARGDGRDRPPDGFRYMSTNGIPRKQRPQFVYDVLEECKAHNVEICIFDSLGVAIEGDPSDRQTVMDLFEEAVPLFEAAGITLWMIDHQRRLQPGEKNQSLGVYGTVLKEYLARAQIQVEFVSRDRENHTVTTRLRPKKAQFGELPEPVEVKTTFSADRITLELVELDDSDRAMEETLSNRDRVRAALQSVGEAGPHEIQEICGDIPLKSVKNTLSKMRNADPPEVFDTGEFESSGAAKVSLSQPYKGGQDRDTRAHKPTCEHNATVGLRCSLCPDEIAVPKEEEVS